MKHTILVAVLFITTAFGYAQTSTSQFFNKADRFFKTYVKDGKVAYEQLANNTSDLKSIIKLSHEISVDKSNENTYKAFWINVYNLGVVEQIVDGYPVNSPMKIAGFFDGNKRMLGGKKITLNDIENKLLRGNFKEPRFHFVLVCGAISCPPIVNYAYRPQKLEAQLEKQTKLAMNNADFIKINGSKTEISEIFSWYKQDFGSSKTNVAAFINKYRDQKITKNFGYYTYNWQLNSQVSKRVSTTTNSTEGLSNVQTFTPSKLLAKGQFDIKFFNSLYTQTRQTTAASSKVIEVPRESFFTSTTEFYVGVSENSRLNVGLIAQYRSNNANSSNALSVFNFENNPNEVRGSRSGISVFAPSIRFQPLANVSNFSLTSSFFIPVFKEGKAEKAFLDKKSFVWETKFFFDHTFGGNQWQIFTEVDLAFNFGDDKDLPAGEDFANNSLGLPISAFLSYFPTNKSTVFVNTQQFFLISLGNDFEQNYTSVGLGGKYQVTDRLNLEASVSKFVRGHNFQGLGQTFSIGLRYLSAN